MKTKWLPILLAAGFCPLAASADDFFLDSINQNPVTDRARAPEPRGAYCPNCGENANPNVGLPRLASPLELETRGGVCPHEDGELARLDLIQRTGHDYSHEWSCNKFVTNLRRDTMGGCAPDSMRVFHPGPFGRRTIRGSTAFVGFVSKPYRYELETTPSGDPQVTVRIGFSGDDSRSPEVLAHFRAQLAQAERIWEENQPTGMHVRFRFLLVPDEQNPSFAPRITRGDTRGPYTTEWSTRWSPNVIAHEVGHMMGLDDEYNQMNVTFGLGQVGVRHECDSGSLMCMEGGVPRAYHYYLILRRAWCHATPDRQEDLFR
jgi:hypothetical protein